MLAGLFNIRLNISWIICFLAQQPSTLAEIRLQIEKTLASHRRHECEDPWTVFERLELREWETKLPLLDAALRETLRFTMSGPLVRKNISGTDIPIGHTKEVIPRGSLAVSGRGPHIPMISLVETETGLSHFGRPYGRAHLCQRFAMGTQPMVEEQK